MIHKNYSCAKLLPLVVGLSAISGVAHAGSEIPSYDARTAGMGGAGITTTRGAATIVNNPALLTTVPKADITVDIFFLDAATDTPVLGPSHQLSSNLVSPVGFLGGAVRLTPKLVIGLAVAPLGAGATYNLPNGEGKLSSQFIGVSSEIGAAYAITRRLSIGASWRPSYLHYELQTPSPTATDASAQTKLDISKTTPLAASLGVYYRIDDFMSAGFFYRSRISTDLTGSASTPFGTFSAHSREELPDKLGIAIDRLFLDNRLLVTAQAELELFGSIQGTQTTTFQTSSGPQSQSTISNDQTTWAGKVGAEYMVIPAKLALRGGIWFGPQQGQKQHANYFTPYYGALAFPSLGLGYKVGRFDIDAVMNWQIKTGVRTSSTDNGNPGSYSSWAFIPGVSGSYHF